MRSLVSSGVSWPKSSKDIRAVVEAEDLATARLPAAGVVKAEVAATNAQAMRAKMHVDR